MTKMKLREYTTTEMLYDPAQLLITLVSFIVINSGCDSWSAINQNPPFINQFVNRSSDSLILHVNIMREDSISTVCLAPVENEQFINRVNFITFFSEDKASFDEGKELFTLTVLSKQLDTIAVCGRDCNSSRIRFDISDNADEFTGSFFVAGFSIFDE